MKPWQKVDFHSHTIYSGDCLSKLPQVIESARRKGLDRLVITDHNTIQGALLAHDYDPELIIVGEEILTEKGELLAAFVKEEVPPLLPPLRAIELLRRQGAFISVSHPYDRLRHGWQLADLEEITPLVDAIEVFNARSLTDGVNEQAVNYAQAQHLSGTIGSDAHSLREIGQAYLELPAFASAEELRKVIHLGRPVKRYSSLWVRLASTYARLYKQFTNP